MKTFTLLPVLAALFLLPGAGIARAGDNGTDAVVKKPVIRRATPESAATPAVRRDSRPPAAPAFIEVRVARAHPAAPWSPGAPGD